jgi:hypothetical protein
MSTASASLTKNGNCCGGESFRAFGSALPLSTLIAKVSQRLWPTKTDYQLAARTKTSDRACRDVLKGRSTLSGESLANLLRSDEGLLFLTAIMADAKPAWWVGFLSHKKLTDKRALAAIAQQEIREALHEFDQLDAALARTETALGLSDADFHRESIDAIGAVRGAAHRPMARRR